MEGFVVLNKKIKEKMRKTAEQMALIDWLLTKGITLQNCCRILMDLESTQKSLSECILKSYDHEEVVLNAKDITRVLDMLKEMLQEEGK